MYCLLSPLPLCFLQTFPAPELCTLRHLIQYANMFEWITTLPISCSRSQAPAWERGKRSTAGSHRLPILIRVRVCKKISSNPPLLKGGKGGF